MLKLQILNTRVHAVEDSLYKVWRLLEDVWKHEIQQMNQCVLTAKARHAQCKVRCCHYPHLAVDVISISQRVFDQRRKRINIITRHGADILQQKLKRLQHTVLDIQVGSLVPLEQINYIQAIYDPG